MDKKKFIHSFFNNRVGVIATMHKKEDVISPILEKELGIKPSVPKNFNTDKFGTFTRDIARKGSQLDAAKQKAEEALAATGKTLAVASEGAFGPHPFIPGVPYNREIILLLDQENDLEIIGEAITTETNYNHKKIKSYQEAYEFSVIAGFPTHGVVVQLDNSAENQNKIIKGFTTEEALKQAVTFALENSHDGSISIETDMRAFYNPTRMKNIEAATRNLVEKIYNLCPNCSWPGFMLAASKKGLPCSWCGLPTELLLSVTYHCKKCGYSEEKYYPHNREKADPGQCLYCNP